MPANSRWDLIQRLKGQLRMIKIIITNTQDLNLSSFLPYVFVREVRRIISVVPLLNVALRKTTDKLAFT